MKIYSSKNVYETALERIERIYRDFKHVTISSSGGKDSTLVLELAVKVATKLARLPVEVMFLDQEAEWTHTVEYFRRLASRPELKLLWYQCPLKISNAGTTQTDDWLYCWKEGDEWIRPKEENSIHANLWGEIRFKESFEAIIFNRVGMGRHAYLTGMRAEESPKRMMGMTHSLSYKDITWCLRQNKKAPHYAFHPVYDWSYTDVWKAIHSEQWDFNEIYNVMFQSGVRLRDMRVSNLNHQGAIQWMFIAQEYDPDLYDAMVQRLTGIRTARKLNEYEAFYIKTLPYMFNTWLEYRDFLFDKLIHDPTIRTKFKRKFRTYSKMVANKTDGTKKIWDRYYKACVKAILLNDYHSTVLSSWETAMNLGKKFKNSKIGIEKWNQASKNH